MTKDKAIRSLKSLRDEILQCYKAASSTDLRHALIAFDGEDEDHFRRLSAAQSVFTPIFLNEEPFHTYRFRTGFNHKWITYCFSGAADKAVLSRFRDQAAGLVSPALQLLASQGRDYGKISRDFEGWIYLCYCVAWDVGDLVNYEILRCDYYNSDVDQGSPFESRARFESWQVGSAQIPVGYFAAKLSRDLRSCTASAIEGILSLESPPPAMPMKLPRKRDPLREARDEWIYHQCESEKAYKNIVRELKHMSEWDSVSSIQRVRQIHREYAQRKGLPITPRQGS